MASLAPSLVTTLLIVVSICWLAHTYLPHTY
jgi:hypothetical protein